MSVTPTTSEDIHQPERVLWSGHRSHWYFLGHWLLGWLLVALVAAGIYYERPALAAYLPWAYAAPLVVLLVVYAVVAFARRQRTYRVTTRRVIAELGRMVKDTTELRIQDIRSMNVHKAGFMGLLGVGKVEFSSAATDDADVIFYQIGGADRVRDLVRSLQS
jgi:uncharacterized membrane protein YdbT with pleckstrin-like domain